MSSDSFLFTALPFVAYIIPCSGVRVKRIKSAFPKNSVAKPFEIAVAEGVPFQHLDFVVATLGESVRITMFE